MSSYNLLDSAIIGGHRLLNNTSAATRILRPAVGERIVITNACVRNTDAAAAHWAIITHDVAGAATTSDKWIYISQLTAANTAGSAKVNVFGVPIYIGEGDGAAVQPTMSFLEIVASPLLTWNIYGYSIGEERGY